MINEKVRVRFAPSPTGYLHIGGLRTALYNYLFAKHNNGEFILRIEDTDRSRYVEGAVENLLSTLNWAGLNFEEGPDKDGKYGPYFQSQRLDIYQKNIETLLRNRNAYHCFCTPERIKLLREEQQKEGLQPKYDKHCLSLTQSEINDKLNLKIPYVIRLNVEPGKIIKIEDIIRGTVEIDSNIVDDQILIKSDGYPTYHLANVVDDHLMKITHVIRGEEWLSSSPKHVLLYDYFGWEKPFFAHLPLLLNSDRSKLSKRQGDVAVEDYKEKGYLKESLINFVALLGWNAGDDKEIYYLDELIEKFTLDRVNKSGAIFNLEKLNWLNEVHIRNMPDEEILVLLKDELSKSKYKENAYTNNYLLQVIAAMKERISFIKDFIEKSFYFFDRPKEYDQDVIKKRWKKETPELLQKLKEEFNKIENPSRENFENSLKNIAVEFNIGLGKLIHPLRLAVSGVGAGPGVFDIVSILGKDETIIRISLALDTISPSKIESDN